MTKKKGVPKGFKHPEGRKRKRDDEVLALVTKEPQSGHEIAQQGMDRDIYLSINSHYAALNRLLEKGFVKSTWISGLRLWSITRKGTFRNKKNG